MSPAGDFASLHAAIAGGADAVYFGLKGFNMRAGARNFSVRDLPRMADICADRFRILERSGADADYLKGAQKRVKMYLALNTICFQGEISRMERLLDAASANGVDAVIAWDFAVISAALERGIEVHLSTQASVANAGAVAAFHEKFGITRFVLARECTLADMAKIRREVAKKLGRAEAAKITFEVFAHGAMCVSESGRCFLSQFAFGRSANRGECVQPCRREYTITDSSANSYTLENNRILSPKDICTLPFLPLLLRAGASSLKIEGRNRNCEYVFETSRAYSLAADFILKNSRRADFAALYAEFSKPLMARLREVFNRGFSDGFYMGRRLSDWHSAGNCATRKKIIIGRVSNFFKKISVAEITVDDNSFRAGDTLQIEGGRSGFSKFVSPQIYGDNSRILPCAKKGMVVAVKTPAPVRRGDLVYVYAPQKGF